MPRTVLPVLMAGLLWLHAAAAAPVAVRFPEGLTHGFLVLRTLDGALIASGDLLQSMRGAEVESRMVFRFKDGLLLEVIEGALVLPADTYNGMVINIAKNLPGGARETVHIVAFTPAARMPPDSHAWIVTDELPAFVRFEGPLHPAGPAWRIELASPRWPESRATSPAAPIGI